MTILSRAISALYNGVSQQPAAQRADSQLELLENAYCTVAEGVRKRPPSFHVARLTTSTPDNVKIHQVFRSETERYVVGVWLNTVKVWNGVTGAEISVDTTTFPGVLSYLDSNNAVDDVQAITVADTTFLVNKTKTVTTSATGAAVSQPPRLFIHVRQGAPEATYYVNVGGSLVTHLTSTTALSQSTTTIAEALKTGLDAVAGFSAYRYGNLVVVYRDDNASFAWDVSDTIGGTGMVAFLNRVERYSDLPREFVEGVTIEVRGAGDTGGKSSFWVTFKRNAGTNTGYWEETIAPNSGEITQFDATTLPLALVRLSATSFRLERPAWASRLVGSAATVVTPSIVGEKISAMFLWRNRLGFLAGENAVLSRAGNLYNLWPKSSTQVNDDDPIDVTVNAPRVSVLRHPVPFQRNLMLFSDTTQFVMTSEGALSPRTVRVDPVTEYDCSPIAPPVSSGRDVFFAFERAAYGASTSYSGVREYYIDANSVSNAANDVTAHVPQYIPSDLFRLSVSTTADVLLALTKVAWDAVYVYSYLWDGDEKVQSAWYRWRFPESKVLSAEASGGLVSLVFQRVGGIHLELIDLRSTLVDTGIGGDEDFLVHLDRRVTLTGVYDSVLNRTTFTLPYGDAYGTVEAVAGPAWGSRRGARLTLTPATSTQFFVTGDWSAHPCIVGLKYTMRLTFSEFFLRDRERQAITTGRLQLRYLTVNFRVAGPFSAEVASDGRDTAVYAWSPFKLGKLSFKTDTPVIEGGQFAIPVASRSDRCQVSLVNDTPYPSTFYSAEWEALYYNRAKRL
jgi:hypothetical protein